MPIYDALIYLLYSSDIHCTEDGKMYILERN